MDAGERFELEVEPGVWTTPQVWTWAEAGVGREGGKGGLFLLWLHFLGQGQASELVSRAVGSGHGEGPASVPRPGLHYQRKVRGVPYAKSDAGGRVAMRSHSSTRHPWVKPHLFHPQPGCELLALDLPESFILTCKMGREVPSGFSQGSH